MKITRKTLTILLLFPIVLAACGAAQAPAEQETDSQPEPIDPTATPALATGTVPPATVTEEPPTSVPAIAAEDLYGRWGHNLYTLDINPDGTYRLAWPAEPDEEVPIEMGDFDLNNNIIRFNPESYDGIGGHTIDGCTDADPYNYMLTFTDNDKRFLKFVVEGRDKCDYRAHQWKAEPVFQLMESYSAQ